MSARKPPCVEAVQHDVHKALGLDLVRHDAFAELSLTFDRRYRRAIQLDRAQLDAFLAEAHRVRALMPEDATP